MNLRFITALLLILLSGSAFAQKKARISGTVTDPDGNPIEIAAVSVKGSAIGAFTNAKGYYSLTVNTGDSCTLIFSYFGYSKVQRAIPSVNGDMTINVQMSNTSIELGGVEIEAERPQTNTMSKLDASALKTITSTSGNAVETMMGVQAGVTTTNELSSQYSVRGGSYDENIVYVNGIEVYRPLLIRSGQQEGLSFINPDLTAAVGFSLGGYEPRYGDKMSSVLDITYKKPEALEGSVSASLMGGTAYIGSHSGNFTQVTGFRYKRGTALLNTLDTKGTYDPNFLDFQTYMTYKLAPKLELGFLGNISRNNYNFEPDSSHTSFGTLENAMNFDVYYDGKEEDRFHTLFGAVTLKYALGERADIGLQASAFQSNEEQNYDISGEYWLSEALPAEASEDQRQMIGIGKTQEHARDRLLADVFNLSATGSFGVKSNIFRWALGYQREMIKDRMKEWEARDSMGYMMPYNGTTVNVYHNLLSQNQIESSRFSGYFQDTYRFEVNDGFFTLTGGIRGSYWDFNNEFIISPRASLGYIPGWNQNYTFRFATGLYYQAPFYKEFRQIETDENGNSTVELNKDIKSQRSIHFVLGGDYSFRIDERRFKFTVETYYKKLDDLVPYEVNNVRIRYAGVNSADGYATGIDMKLFGEFVPKTDSWLCLSFMRARQNLNGKQVPLPTEQPMNLSLYFTDYFPNNDRITFNLRGIWASGLPFSAPGKDYENSFRGSPYRRIDMGMSYLLLGENDDARNRGGLRYLKNVWVGLDAFNLLNIKNVNSYSWIADIYGNMFAVPNYLTSRQFNVKLLVEF